MRNFNAILFGLVFGVTLTAHGEWSVVSVASEFSADKKVEHRHVIMRGDGGAEATIELAVFSQKNARLRVIDHAEDFHSELAKVMETEHCIAGTNGGYFDPEFNPVGLLVVDHEGLTLLSKSRLLSGVLTAGKGRVQLFRVGEYSAKRGLGTELQCGPFLVDRGQPVAGLNDTRGARRTFVAVSGERAAVGYCSGATLAELSRMLASAGVMSSSKIERALNLDGGSSSAFWFDNGRQPLSIPEEKHVRNFIGISAN